MSEEQLKAFLEKVKGDTTLQEKLKAAKSPEDVVGIAKEYGYEFTAETLLKKDSTELSKEELEGVTGGYQFLSMNYGNGWCGKQTQVRC
ncbi:nif11-like leader peptide domain protein [Synechococcus sp. BIOS-E4-1]|uniref:Nif11-like leader peptide family natural product precursor n=1 Tax=Synechococcus sp. BIOS-E4-1 TaxID=1400864 RepID=UPI001648C79A|nr:Nif11-like leader peptide family natural product precursor [Synechococcus sp. BIOS-E4-1]QNI54179.1 nif11-like leader peptide domain protein [Synechococcus sp. BIOS-E4-1]